MAAIDLYIEKYNVSDTIHKCLNTDSKELIELVTSRSGDYFVINRDENLAGDVVAKMTVIKDCLVKTDNYYHISHDIIIDLDITSPLRTIKDIHAAIKKKKENRSIDIIFSVTTPRRNPYFNMVKQNNDGTVYKICDSNYTARQQAPKVFDMNASIYVYESGFLRKNQSNLLFDGICDIIEMYDTVVLDIDSEEDLIFMELIAKLLYEKKVEFKEIYNNVWVN